MRTVIKVNLYNFVSTAQFLNFSYYVSCCLTDSSCTLTKIKNIFKLNEISVVS